MYVRGLLHGNILVYYFMHSGYFMETCISEFIHGRIYMLLNMYMITYQKNTLTCRGLYTILWTYKYTQHSA